MSLYFPVAGGVRKLLALLAASDVVGDLFESRYGQRLAGVVATCATGLHYPQLNRLNVRPGGLYRRVGATAGYSTWIFSRETLAAARQLAQRGAPAARFGPNHVKGIRLLRTALRMCRLDEERLLRTDLAKGVYVCDVTGDGITALREGAEPTGHRHCGDHRHRPRPACADDSCQQRSLNARLRPPWRRAGEPAAVRFSSEKSTSERKAPKRGAASCFDREAAAQESHLAMCLRRRSCRSLTMRPGAPKNGCRDCMRSGAAARAGLRVFWDLKLPIRGNERSDCWCAQPKCWTERGCHPRLLIGARLPNLNDDNCAGSATAEVGE